jgi:hypothetical protein
MAWFQIAKRRDRDAAKALLGEGRGGVIVTDRYAVYVFVDDTLRQLCLAHLARDLIALSERDGAPGRLGRALSDEFGRVFTTLHAPGPRRNRRVGGCQTRPGRSMARESKVPRAVGEVSLGSGEPGCVGQPLLVAAVEERGADRAVVEDELSIARGSR